MTTTSVTRLIDAPVDKVFRTVAHIDEFSKVVPDIARVEMLMNARPHKLLAKLVTPLIKNAVQQAIEKDLEAVKRHCEA